ncbi:hypothetical protein BH11PLA2_BH11PLA2_08650 [soil metagenome]
MSATLPMEPARREALKASVSLLQTWADYTLPPELDRRILHLGENKEFLTAAERAELEAWVAFTQKRSLEKFGAQVVLQQLQSEFPEIEQP